MVQRIRPVQADTAVQVVGEITSRAVLLALYFVLAGVVATVLLACLAVAGPRARWASVWARCSS